MAMPQEEMGSISTDESRKRRASPGLASAEDIRQSIVALKAQYEAEINAAHVLHSSSKPCATLTSTLDRIRRQMRRVDPEHKKRYESTAFGTTRIDTNLHEDHRFKYNVLSRPEKIGGLWNALRLSEDLKESDPAFRWDDATGLLEYTMFSCTVDGRLGDDLKAQLERLWPSLLGIEWKLVFLDNGARHGHGEFTRFATFLSALDVLRTIIFDIEKKRVAIIDLVDTLAPKLREMAKEKLVVDASDSSETDDDDADNDGRRAARRRKHTDASEQIQALDLHFAKISGTQCLESLRLRPFRNEMPEQCLDVLSAMPFESDFADRMPTPKVPTFEFGAEFKDDGSFELILPGESVARDTVVTEKLIEHGLAKQYEQMHAAAHDINALIANFRRAMVEQFVFVVDVAYTDLRVERFEMHQLTCARFYALGRIFVSQIAYANPSVVEGETCTSDRDDDGKEVESESDDVSDQDDEDYESESSDNDSEDDDDDSAASNTSDSGESDSGGV
jgi:hypothetical protein